MIVKVIVKMKTTRLYTLLALLMVFVGSCNKPDEPDNVSGRFNGHDYVDLGLPSGTLWATCNIGANLPEEFGDCFSWGEIEPKGNYIWSDYKFGVYPNITKYNTNPDYGTVDSLTVLLAVDDAATINWGWYMPTVDQWRELRDSTTHIWTTQNGVKGMLFTSNNGHSIFLPAPKDSSGVEVGTYWSNSLCEPSSLAWGYYFNSVDYGVGGLQRWQGLNVRPVCYSK
jgi:hypothetical protein